MPDRVWEVDVVADEDGTEKLYTVTVEAEDEERAKQKARAEIGLALALLNPVYKVLRVSARSKS